MHDDWVQDARRLDMPCGAECGQMCLPLLHQIIACIDMRKLAKQMGVLAMAWLVSVSVSAYDFEVDGMYYNVVSLEDLTASLTYGETEYAAESVVIPETVVYKGRTLTVTSIGGYAFSGCSSLVSVELPDGVTSIGYGAFSGCSSLVSVELPDGVTSIGDDAFSDCSSLVSVEIPDGVTSIGGSAFSGCSSLVSVEIPNSVTDIGNYAFSGCSSLVSVELPDECALGILALADCRNLTSVTLGSWVPFSESGSNDQYLVGLFGEYWRGHFSIGDVLPVSSLHFLDSQETLTLEIHAVYDRNYGDRYGYYYNYSETYFLRVKQLYIGRPLRFSGWKGDLYEHGYDCFSFGGWFTESPIEEIEFGGFLESDEVPGLGGSLYNVEVVIYGKNITQINNPLTSASEIYLKTTTPPQSEEWNNDNYLNTIVYVPEGSLAAYQAADVWKNFWDIREWDGVTTGIASAPTASRQEPLATVEGKQITVHADADDTRIHVYNAGGCLVYSGTERVVNVDNSGLYIVRVGTHAQKLLVR